MPSDGPLPKNVHLIQGEHAISSFALGKASDVVMTYTSTLGLEFSLAGIRSCVAAVYERSWPGLCDLLEKGPDVGTRTVGTMAHASNGVC